MLNYVIAQGRIIKSEKFPFEYRAETGKTQYMRLFINVQQNFKSEGQDYPGEDRMELRAFGKTADFIHKYFNRGDNIMIEGAFRQPDNYVKKDGSTGYAFPYIVVNQVHFQYGMKKGEEATASKPVASTPAATPTTPNKSRFNFGNKMNFGSIDLN